MLGFALLFPEAEVGKDAQPCCKLAVPFAGRRWLLVQSDTPHGETGCFPRKVGSRQAACQQLWAEVRAAGDRVAQFAGHVLALSRRDLQMAQKILLL